MGSFKGNGRGQSPKGRRNRAVLNHNTSPSLEGLEARRLLNATPGPVDWVPTSTNLYDPVNGPLANLGTDMVSVYKAYAEGANATQLQAEFPTIEFQNGMIGVDLKMSSGDLSTYVTDLQNLGVQVLQQSATYDLVDGWAPINEIPTIAQMPQTLSGSPNYFLQPQGTSAVPYQGAADNEALQALDADVARASTGLNGAGVTIGVISDSVNQYTDSVINDGSANNLTGLAASYASGDLVASQVTVLSDLTGFPGYETDEGRAMMENIHDIAPGADLDFATGELGGPLGFASAIEALAAAGCKIIVNDLGSSFSGDADPMFQDGVVAQAINTVTAEGVTVFSSAGNDGAANGYLSTFRPVTGTITGIGTGTFMNFNPGSGTNLELPINTYYADASLEFQFDQPDLLQEVAGSTASVTSQVNIYVLNSSGTVVWGTSTTTPNANEIAQQAPVQTVTIANPGSYFVAIQVVSGTNPGHIEFVSQNDTNQLLSVSTQYGSAGGTYYPSSFGHNADAENIGVGASPWWAAPAFLNTSPQPNEPFSSSGPSLITMSDTGVQLSSPITVLNPSVTAPQGGNTSFFSPGNIINTSDNPPFETGEPYTLTNLSQNLPSFFGTSSAAPNAAAVAALMIQEATSESLTLTPAQIKADLIAGATPMNGTAQGSWNAQSGYGLVNAANSIAIVGQLKVATETPSNGSTLTTAPSVIQVTFNKPVNFSTISAGDLVFSSAPTGVTVLVGTPIAVDNPTDPTVVDFPISFQGSVIANGSFTYSLASPNGATVVGQDGTDLVPTGPISFTLADTTAPTIVNTTESGRTITITFSKALNPATAISTNIFAIRQGSASSWNPTATDYNTSNYTDISSDPRTVTTYNPLTYTVTIDYSLLPQTSLPSDNYAIVVSDAVTDLVGNPLDGLFSGSFPTTSNSGAADSFVQNLGFVQLQAPVILSFAMTPTPSNDTGVAGDQNTNISAPSFQGQVYAPFPSTVSGLTVYVQFAGLVGDTPTLTTGPGGRGETGYNSSTDYTTTTDANGAFTIQPLSALPEGFQSVTAVVVAQPDIANQAGLSSEYTDFFRIDNTAPTIVGGTIDGSAAVLPLVSTGINTVNSLTTISLNVVDPSLPASGNYVTPSNVVFQALEPSTATNISNYSLINSTTLADVSQYIASATFTPLAPTLSGNDVTAYNGTINISFLPGLPAGSYEFIARTHEGSYPGLASAAGTPLNDTDTAGEDSAHFTLNIQVGSTPVHITSLAMENGYSANGSTAVGGVDSYYEELPTPTGTNTRDNVATPPNTFVIDLSNPIPYQSAGYYNSAVQLISSTTGDFGNLGQSTLGSTGSGFTIVPGTTVTLYNFSGGTNPTSSPVTTGGTGNRLVLTLPTGTVLPAAYYRLYIPNSGANTISDIYGNQLDGEFLGNATSSTSPDFPNSTVSIPEYEDELSNGTFVANDMSGDGTPGGAFMTAFTVVNYGNVVYARAGYVENPNVPATLSNGTPANPFPVLAAEGDPTNTLLASNPSHNPLLGLNNPAFFEPTNFNSAYDFSGDGQFEQSAFYAASQLAYNNGSATPVVIVALPGYPTAGVAPAYSIVSPAGTGDAGASIPADTTLVLQAGATVKLESASLFVQNEGSALISDGTQSAPVTFTSYNDATIGGATNGNTDTHPVSGDWGGIVFRNFDEAANDQNSFPVDGTLTDALGALAVSGAQDALSLINFTNIEYAGGAVPQGTSNFYSAITLYNSRPTITNDNISKSGGTGGSEGAIGADLDSFREDDTARGPLIRQDVATGNSLNGIYLMAESNGLVQATDAMSYAPNPATLGGTQNYAFDETLPLIITSQIDIGTVYLDYTGGQQAYNRADRLYIDSGSMLKFDGGSGLEIDNQNASLNVGSRSYISGYDANNAYNPNSIGFVAESANDPTVLFTSIYDDTATTPFVPAVNVTGETTPRTLTEAMWGSVSITDGAVTVINAATFTYGGGAINTQEGTLDSQSVLAFLSGFSTNGTHAYITNNNFLYNFDAAMQIDPNGLLAGDPLRPLESGHPFFRGNVMESNGIDGLAVVAARGYLTEGSNFAYVGPVEDPDPTAENNGFYNQTVSTVWDSTDLTYVLRGTITLGPQGIYGPPTGSIAPIFDGELPSPNLSAYSSPPAPTVSLTIQAALPGTLLADGSTIPSPGQSVIVKLLNDQTPNGAGNLTGDGSAGNDANYNAGAGFVVGVDDGVAPPVNPLLDPGAYSALRILGIPGNQTTGQQRVPVILTSLRDDTVGTTVRGVQMYNIFNSFPTGTYVAGGAYSVDGQAPNLTTPEPGDGGYIYIGGNSLTSYDATNPLEGSIISNADISYMTRIEVQGGGLLYTYNTPTTTPTPTVAPYGAPTLNGGLYYEELAGDADPATQFNAPMSFTIEDSNLSDFSDAAVFVHPDVAKPLFIDETPTLYFNPSITPQPFYGISTSRGTLLGEPVFLYMYNDTISNSKQGIHINTDSSDDTSAPSVYQAVIQNVTFYNDQNAIETISPAFDGKNGNSGLDLLAMNDIFDGSLNDGTPGDGTGVAISLTGLQDGTQLQYNLFYNNTMNVVAPDPLEFGGNQGATYANPNFVGPVGAGYDATAQDYELQSNSPAIDAGRSEIGPLGNGNAIYPGLIITLPNGGGVLSETRTDPNTLPSNEVPGDTNLFGENGGFFGFNNFGTYDSRQIVTLPGSGNFSFPDQWQPVLTSALAASGQVIPTGYSGLTSEPGTYDYAPENGIRDILGYIRVPDPGAPSVGYGSNPFIDIGAYQYVNLHPPEVTAVTANETSSPTAVPFYTAGGEAGANATPQTLNVTFSGPIDPTTLTASTVELEDLGPNPLQPLDSFISLAGKISYSSATDTMSISLAGSGLNLSTGEYRLILLGNGSPVIEDTQGVALDGESYSNGDNPATGVQLPLPSGNGYPGGNFYDTFIINTVGPTVTAGTFQLSPASDSSNGLNITKDANPTFTGSITESNAGLVPIDGQTALLDIGLSINGTTYYSASQLPANLSQYASYIRPDAGSALTVGAQGSFSVTVGTDGAATGLVTNTSALPSLQAIWSVNPATGLLAPVSSDNFFYVARVRVIDQSGNPSNPLDPNAQVPFIVDTTAPTATINSPTANQVITSLVDGELSFTITTSENINKSTFSAASILVDSAGADGILGNADDVAVPVNQGSIVITPLDTPNGGTGREQITFQTSGPLTDNKYSVTLLNTGANAITDLAGNALAAPVTQDFEVAVPSLTTNLFVGKGYQTNASDPVGSRENPYTTISAAMSAASAGDVVAVLPGVYTENVTLKQFVRLLSASVSSTDYTVFTTSTGSAIDTIIRAPDEGYGVFNATVNALDLESFTGLETEISGFTIAAPLAGDSAAGLINTLGVAVNEVNSNLLIDKNYIIDAGIGIGVTTSGVNALVPQIYNNVVAGNIDGLYISDAGTTSQSAMVQVINNDFVYNTIGIDAGNKASSPEEAYIASNIFWENHDLTPARNGLAIYSAYPNKVTLQNNMFSSNGDSDTSQAYATNDLGNGFNPATLSSIPGPQGNYVGTPDFVSPRDPRPTADGPALFFLESDFQLMSNSQAIDNAWEPTAITTDLLGNSQTYIGTGFNYPNFGPRDIGAFEYDGTGGNTLGGTFRVVTTALDPATGVASVSGGVLSVSSQPTAVTVTFSDDVDTSKVSVNDLVLSGTAINPASPVHATSLTWLSPTTVEFNLSGTFNSTGTVNVSIAAGAVTSTSGVANQAYSDNVVLSVQAITTPTPTTGPIGVTTPVVTVSPSPAPTPSPVTVNHKKHKPAKHAPVVHKPVKHKPVVHHAPVKHKVIKVITEPTTTHPAKKDVVTVTIHKRK